ncbi:MAG: c-type cytochrome [Nitrospinae bacterium]|nr:c-type cytochrome [Nitrospinota bacterium]
MVNFLKIIVFSLVLMFCYSGFANYAIPVMIPEPPPKEAVISGEMSMEDFIALGGSIFNGKGTCTLCHNPVGGRAPLLEGVGARAAERIKDARYKGKATNGGEYIHESMVNPSAFVVSGFGKPGTNDTVSPMPDISKGSIGLNEGELNAVIAYLQSSSGVEVTVSIPKGGEAAASKGKEAPAALSSAATAEEAIKKHGCGMCHKVLAEEGEMGPSLKEIGKVAQSRVKGMSADDYIRKSILKPNDFVAPGFDPDMMPGDFGEKMTAKELEMIVSFLKESKG